MNNSNLKPKNSESSASAGDLLESWKEIASHLNRDIRTVQRWEKSEGLPLHRHMHSERGTIYAFRAEVDAWWAGRRTQLEMNGGVPPGAPPDPNGRTEVRGPAVRSRLNGKGTAAPRPRLLLWALAAMTVIVALAYVLRPPLPPPFVSNYCILTNDHSPKWLFNTEGARLFLHEQRNPGLPVSQVSVAGGDVVPVASAPTNLILLNASLDGSDLLMEQVEGTNAEGPLWALPTLGSAPRRLGSARGHAAVWSPGRDKLVYANGADLFEANGDGTEPHKLASLPSGFAVAPPFVASVAWSPDGHEIRFAATNLQTRLNSIWQISSDGSNPHPLFPDWHRSDYQCCGKWTPNGAYYVFESRDQIWAVSETRSLLRKASRDPVQLTAGAIAYLDPVPSADGRKLFAVARLSRGELNRYEPKSGKFAPYLGGISAQDVAFSKDGQWATYVSHPDGALWQSKVDGTSKVQLSKNPMYALQPHWSPDGNSIVFGGLSEIAGGSPGIRILDLNTRRVSTLPGSERLFSPRWSPDGNSIVALLTTSLGMRLYDVRAQKWSELSSGEAAYPCWSRNSRFVYFAVDGAVKRVDIRSRRIEEVASLKGFPTTGVYGGWFGLAPDDSPLELKDAGTDEIVSTDFHEP